MSAEASAGGVGPQGTGIRVHGPGPLASCMGLGHSNRAPGALLSEKGMAGGGLRWVPWVLGGWRRGGGVASAYFFRLLLLGAAVVSVWLNWYPPGGAPPPQTPLVYRSSS